MWHEKREEKRNEVMETGKRSEPLCPGPFHFSESHLLFSAEPFRPDVDPSAPTSPHKCTRASTRVYVHRSIPLHLFGFF